MAPIRDDGSGKILYESQTNAPRTNDTDVHEDDMFAICDTFNVLKQIKFAINSPTSASGTLTLQWNNAGGDAVVDLLGIGGGLTSLNTLTASTQVFAIGTSGTGPNWSSSVQTHTLNIPIATNATSGGGLIDTSTQNLFGRKRFNENTTDYGSSWNCVEGNISPVDTVNSGNAFLVGVWGSAEGPSNNFTTGQLVGTLGFGGSGTSAATISSITGLYGWAQSHSAYTGQLGYIYGGSFLARHLNNQTNTGIVGIGVQALTEIANTQSAVGADIVVSTGTPGTIVQGSGVSVSFGSNITSMIGFTCTTAGSYNEFRGVRLVDADDSYLRFYESDQTNYVGFKAPTTIASDVTWTLPNSDGSSGQVLSTNGSGTLSWATATASPYWGNAVANFASLPGTGTTGETRVTLDTQNYYQWDGSNWDLVGAGPLTIGAIDTPTTSANGLHISANVLYAQSATTSVPGMVNTTTQTFAGQKTLQNTFVDKTTDNIGLQNVTTITNTGNIASSHNEFASYSVLSKTDNFNQTGIGFFAASVSGASHTGSGTFGNTYLVSSLNATTVSGSGTHNRVYGGYTGSSQTSGSTVSKLYGHYSYATSGAISITTDVYGYSADITCLNNITNSYGFIVESISLSGTGNKYAFFCDDTGAKSVFAGGVYGSTAGGILQLSGSTTLASRVEVLATQDFRLVANSGSNQSYQFTRAVNNHLDLQGLKAGSLTSLRMFCADGDGTDSNSIQIFAVGTPGATTNSEVLAFGWDNTNTRFGIQTGATGSGTVRNLHIYTSSDTDQFVLNSNGDISIQDYITFDTAVKRQEHTTTVIDLGLGGSQLNYTNQVNISNTATQTNDPTIIGGNVFVEKTDNFAENGSGLYCGFNSSFIFNGTNTIGSSNITVGIIGTLSNDSTGTFSGPLAVGVAGSVTNNVAGTLTSCVSVYADMDNFDVGGTISVGYGFKASLANSGGGTFTTAAVLYSDTIEATNKYGVWIDVDGSINKLHELQILDANAVKWHDTDSSNYVAFKGAGTISSNVTWTLPTSDAQGAFISDGSATMSIKTLNNGTYTPTLTNVTNISASTAYKCQWMRVGNTVTVSGKADIDITSVGAYELGISLPVASNFAAEEDCCGVASSVALNEYSPYIKADATNNRASLNGSDNDTSNHAHYFTFTYEVI